MTNYFNKLLLKNTRILIFGKYGLDMFVSGDQLLRGAALNAVLIAKSIIDNK